MADAEQILRKYLENIIVDLNLINPVVNIKSVSSGGANFTTVLYSVKIAPDSKDAVNLFAKVAALGDKMRTAMPMRVYEVEHRAYTELLKKYQHLEIINNVPDEHKLQIPKYYGSSIKVMEEIMILEDLTVQGYTVYDRLKSIDWEYAATAIEEMAKLHALSFAYGVAEPEEFKDLVKDLEFEWVMNDEQAKSFWDNILLSGIESTREENKELLKDFFSTFDGGRKFLEYYEPLRRCALIHRDFRISNLMHKVESDGRIRVKIVDYQTLQGGSPVIDILYFIFTGSDVKFRAEYYHKLIDHYYSQLSQAMQRLGLNPENTYSREDFYFELKEKLPFGLAIAIFSLPLVMVEAENAPKVDENLDLTSLSVVNTSDLFRERINGVVDDFIRWGII
uniref:Ecdysteroid 22-kinase n=1 Tax=Antheraea pernyi TaxID=7119 RepID=A0A0S1MMB6_ANTPE|nr:ecdysteroid 22-kinase [Antheraea pernyi]